jgi:hypothetical protein
MDNDSVFLTDCQEKIRGGRGTYFFFEMMTYLLVTPIIFFFCMADTTFALKRSEESGA